MALLDYLNPRKKTIAEMAFDDDYYDQDRIDLNQDNPANLIDFAESPTLSPASQATEQQYSSLADPYKDLVDPEVGSMNLDEMPSNSIGGMNQYTDPINGSRLRRPSPPSSPRLRPRDSDVTVINSGGSLRGSPNSQIDNSSIRTLRGIDNPSIGYSSPPTREDYIDTTPVPKRYAGSPSGVPSQEEYSQHSSDRYNKRMVRPDASFDKSPEAARRDPSLPLRPDPTPDTPYNRRYLKKRPGMSAEDGEYDYFGDLQEPQETRDAKYFSADSSPSSILSSPSPSEEVTRPRRLNTGTSDVPDVELRSLPGAPESYDFGEPEIPGIPSTPTPMPNQPSYRDVAMRQLGYDQEKYKKRGFKSVIGDIAKGALRGMTTGQGAIGGAISGGLGDYRQGDRTRNINQKVKEYEDADERDRKDTTLRNTEANTQSLIADRVNKDQNADQDRVIKANTLKARVDIATEVNRIRNNAQLLNDKKYVNSIVQKAIQLDIMMGPNGNPAEKAELQNTIRELSKYADVTGTGGIAVPSSLGAAALQTKQDTRPGIMADDQVNDRRVLVDPFTGTQTNTGLPSRDLWRQKQAQDMLKLRAQGKGGSEKDSYLRFPDKGPLGFGNTQTIINKKDIPVGGGKYNVRTGQWE